MTVMALKQVSKLLGVLPHRIQHAYTIGAVEEPRLRISGRRVFEQADLCRLARHFRVELKADQAPPKPERAEAADAE